MKQASEYPIVSDKPLVTCELKDKVATVNLCAPENLNMLNEQFVHEFHNIILDLRYDDECRAIVLTAEGDAFFGCGDLEQMIFPRFGANEMIARQCMHEIHSAAREMRDCGKPVIACMDAMSLGGGCGLTLAADVIFGTEKAGFFVSAHALFGLLPDCGGMYNFARLCGPQKAIYYSLRPEPITAQEALEDNLITRLFPSKEAMMEEAYKFANFIATLPPYAIQGIKNVGQHVDEMNYETHRLFEAESVANGVNTKDFKILQDKIMQKIAEAEAKGEKFTVNDMATEVLLKADINTYKGY